MVNPVETPQSSCRAGIARADITPPVGIYHRMWGAATHDRSTGVHRPLTATALAIAPLDTNAVQRPIVILALDHCLFWQQEMQALLTLAASVGGVSVDQILICCSHTHAAGLMGFERSELPGGDLIVPYLEVLGKRCGQLVRQAIDSLEPAHITYGTGRCSLAAQRDLWDEKLNKFVVGYNPTRTADDALLVGRVTAADGRLLATVVNYACHPTTLAWDNTLISPDYPGAMRELVEVATASLCIFLQGASGDLGPRDGFVGDLAVADRNGRQLGHAVLAALESLPPPATTYTYRGPIESGTTLGIWDHVTWSEARAQQSRSFMPIHEHLRLPLHPDMPTSDAAKQQLADWTAREEQARRTNDEAVAHDCRAHAERLRRLIVNLKGQVRDGTVPLPTTVCRLGDAFWVFVAGEHYQQLQVELRARHPGLSIVVVTLANGWNAGYVVPAEIYGRSIYAETVSLVAAGSLEQLIDWLDAEITRLQSIS